MSACARAKRAILDAEEPNHDTDRPFYPHDKLGEILTRDLVAQVLDCPCRNCRQYREDLKLVGQPSDWIDIILDDAISLFALLIFIDAAPFVACFLTRQVNDQNIRGVAESFSNNIGEHYWGRFHKHRGGDSRVVAGQFRRNLFQFAVPTLTSRNYHTFEAKTILPFVEQERLGRTEEDGSVVNEGAHGTVYAFKIWPAYNALPNSEGIEWFVRKELDVPTRLFDMERRNLEMANRLQDPHIVRIIKTYKHGSKYNIIFPRSRTNLRGYLREDKFVNPISPLEANPIWQQVLGVARALDRIINYDMDTGSTDELGYYGFHFDLKPENILVENDDTLLISDFGQATFVKRGGSSRVIGHGGTDTYAPPEIDNLNERQTRKYDIWSLGCVLIEIVTVIVRGSRDLDEFERLRVTSAANMTDDRFFETDPTFIGPGRKYRVKKVILDWIQDLPMKVTSQTSKNFLDEIVHLIKHMLAVDASDRAPSDEVVRHLDDILRQHQKRNDIQPELIQAKDGESTVGETKLGEIKYAFKMGDPAELWFKGVTTSSAYSFDDDKFLFHTPQDAHIMQSVLTGQHVKLSYQVEKVDYKTHDRLRKAIRHFPISIKSNNKLDGIEEACVIQLWIETNYTDQRLDRQLNRVELEGHPPRGLSQPKDVPLGRAAIFHYNRIVVVPFALNWTTWVDSNVTDSKILYLKPRDPRIDPYFSAATLKSSNDEYPENHCHPGIPLDMALLREQEETNRFECSKITIHFKVLQGTLIEIPLGFQRTTEKARH
ncbi:uncharacterized protein TRUGW13939_01861 [Talaromyces rugulosus]|uniref:Protein kinase domain-containing protein n=1 Tax=Talaromyces rugulosus TaxID=121627 RepID=A0A7H8QLU6_TALRU|nr:uncharacterized protein TRUGW13939_01861 [Talaromyces rugulosus]QKX54772.1 hypothetical protein TRUGW13939_01861 [Talaromyces rugulosus]